MLGLLRLLRLLVFSLVFLAFLTSMGIAGLLDRFQILKFSFLGMRLGRFYARLILRVFAISSPQVVDPLKGPCLYVANHLSYLDAVLMFAHLDAHFVTSLEMKNTAGLGWLCRAAQCVFVNRDSIWNLPQEVSELEGKLRSGSSVFLFPEGTTSNGGQVHAFKSSLIEAAVRAGVPVVSLCIRLVSIDGKPLQASDYDYYCWYGDKRFLPHLLGLSRARPLVAEVMQVGVEGKAGKEGRCRKTISRRAFRVIRRAYFKDPQLSCQVAKSSKGWPFLAKKEVSG